MPLSSLSIIKSSRDSTNPSYLATFLKEEISRFARIKELMARKLKGTHPLKYIKKKTRKLLQRNEKFEKLNC